MKQDKGLCEEHVPVLPKISRPCVDGLTHNSYVQLAQSPALMGDAHGAVRLVRKVGSEFPTRQSF